MGEAASGAEAIQLCETLHPDVILMDMRMPGLDGVQTTRRIREDYPHIRILALTSFEDEETIQQVMQAGAVGYLQKGVSIDELANAIRAAQAGKPTLSPEAFDVLVRRSASGATEPDFGLTDRELQVLEMLVRGASNSEIAEGLVITEATVKYHITNLLNKLEAANRTEAAARAVQHKVVPFSP